MSEKKQDQARDAFCKMCKAHGYEVMFWGIYDFVSGLAVRVMRRSDATVLENIPINEGTTPKEWFLLVETRFADFDQLWYGEQVDAVAPSAVVTKIKDALNTFDPYVEYSADTIGGVSFCCIRAEIINVGIFDLRFTGPMVPSQVDKIVKFFESLEG